MQRTQCGTEHRVPCIIHFTCTNQPVSASQGSSAYSSGSKQSFPSRMDTSTVCRPGNRSSRGGVKIMKPQPRVKEIGASDPTSSAVRSLEMLEYKRCNIKLQEYADKKLYNHCPC